MNVAKLDTETYVLTKLDKLDPVTVYVTNYKLGQGKVVIECFGDAWSYYWASMGEMTLQQFFVSAGNEYILDKLLTKTRQTDLEKITKEAHKKGFDICVTNDVELAMQREVMEHCFGPEWYMDLPECVTEEYRYLFRIVSAIKGAFSEELKQAA